MCIVALLVLFETLLFGSTMFPLYMFCNSVGYIYIMCGMGTSNVKYNNTNFKLQMYTVSNTYTRASAAWMSVFFQSSRFRPDTAHCNVPPGPSVHIRATSSTTNWPVKPVAPNTMIWYGLLLDVVSVAIVCVIRARRKHTDEVRETAAAPLLSLLYSISAKYRRLVDQIVFLISVAQP